jgi:hypothetical protein
VDALIAPLEARLEASARDSAIQVAEILGAAEHRSARIRDA